jgi:hypothetical protein
MALEAIEGEKMILVDRSRYVRRMKHCQAAAYLEYEYDGGVGLRSMSEALPLATGGGVHKPLQKILEHARDHNGELLGREEVKKEIDRTIGEYKKRVLERGFDGESSEMAPFVVAEQATLIEGLVWAAYRVFFPWLLNEFTILDVEREEFYVVGCTCGIGDGQGFPFLLQGRVLHATEQEAPRECEGVCLMSRPDFLAERKIDGIVGVHDFKTNAYEPREHEHKLQFAFGVLGAERRLGREISHYYVHTLLKGKRDFASKDDKENGGVKKQNSPLCYAYYKEADPPFEGGEWGWDYTRAKGWTKVPTWMSPVIQNAGGIEAMVMDIMPMTKVEELVNVSPPFQRPTGLIDMMLQEIVSEEKEWAFKVSQVTGPADENFPIFIRRSWDCENYYGRPCEFKGICDKYPGWETPHLQGRWIARVPNHLVEKEVKWDREALKKRGWQVREEEMESED